jgi:hypothetical protein
MHGCTIAANLTGQLARRVLPTGQSTSDKARRREELKGARQLQTYFALFDKDKEPCSRLDMRGG